MHHNIPFSGRGYPIPISHLLCSPYFRLLPTTRVWRSLRCQYAAMPEHCSAVPLNCHPAHQPSSASLLQPHRDQALSLWLHTHNALTETRHQYEIIATDSLSGPAIATSPTCMSHVQESSWLNGIWHRYLAWEFILISRACSKVKVIQQGQRSREKNIPVLAMNVRYKVM